jgi:transposase
MGQFDLSDDEWAIIEPHFPKAGRGPARQSIIVTTDGANAVFGRASLMRWHESEKIV